MVLIDVILHDHQYTTVSVNWYVILLSLIALFAYLYKKQIAINDKQYLAGMIEHHSMALLQSAEIIEKTDNYDITKLAKNIIQTQTDELTFMIDLMRK